MGEWVVDLRGAARELNARERLHGAEERIYSEIQILRRQHRTRAIPLEHVVACNGIPPELERRVLDVAVQAEQRMGRQIIREDRRLLEEERQVVLDPSGRESFAHILVESGARRIAFEPLPEALTKARLAGLVHREFARWQEADLVDLVDAALGVHVEGADALDLVVEEVYPVRQNAAHRKEIDQSATHAVLAGRQHLRHVGVACEGELSAQLIERELLSLPQEERVSGEI